MISLLTSLVLALFQQATAAQVYESMPEIVATQDNLEAEKASASPLAAQLLKGDKPKWIWGEDENKKYRLTKTFKITKPKDALLRASSDNELILRINGKLVGQSDDWQNPLHASVIQDLRDGENTIEADVANQGGAAAFVFTMVVEQEDGKIVQLISDASWSAKSGQEPAASAKIMANYGEGPWGDILAQAGNGSNRDVFRVQPGFQVERLFKVPREELGSWVCLAVDPKGRLIASDQGNQGLVRITPSPIGSSQPTKIERLNVKISSAQGMLFAFDSLYVIVNGDGTGLYRLRDTDGDDQFDEKTLLTPIQGGGEHGPHAIRLSPDGKSIVLVGGNHTPLPVDRILTNERQSMGGAREGQLHATLPKNLKSRIAPNWDEDVLPTRMWDANGHATGIYAPGGWVAQTDPEGKSLEILSIGYRNQYDFDFNADGEMFVYDSDMEWDMGTSWYRPTRVVHASSGSEFGWRSGTACWPTNYSDSLPSLVDIGPGSPVGVTFGYGAKFPSKYQKALYICDWTFGTMYAIHMEPNGSTYKAHKEEFLSKTPLPLTDGVVGPDGALYFTVGGRGTQSELYRVTYVGKEATAKSNYHDEAGAELRKLRKSIEVFHREYNPSQPLSKESLNLLTRSLDHADAYIRYAARVALERVPDALASSILQAKNADGTIEAAMGVARSGEPKDQSKVIQALGKLEWKSLSEKQKVNLLRAYELTLIRLGKVDDATRENLTKRLDGFFDDASELAKRELAILLVYLDAPSVPTRFVPLLDQASKAEALSTEELLARNRGYGSSIAAMLSNQPDLQQVHYALVLREQRSGWTLDLRKKYFAWFAKAQKWSGGNSYQKFLVNISNDAFKSASDQDRLALEALGLRTPPPVPKELPKAVGPGRDYNIDDLLKLASQGMKGRNLENGKKMYAAGRCVVCHRFAGEGGSTGPDLTQAAGRFAAKDIIEAIIEPSKVISDQYKTVIVATDEGTNYSGRVVAETPEALILVTDPEDSTKTVTIKKSDIAGTKTSTESVMPRGLLKELNEQESLDLIAYILARGNPNDSMFK